MKLSSRLLLPLLAAMAVVMLVFAWWAVRQRVTSLADHARRETHAYAVALELAIESAFRDTSLVNVQQIIDRISRELTIYGVLVYGPDSEVLFLSDPLGNSAAAPSADVERVIATGEALSIQREIDDQAVYSVVRPIRDQRDRVVGAFEVAQPLAFVTEQIRMTRQRFLLNTITLLLAVTLLILWLVRQFVSRPLDRFVAAAQALGRGELTHRIGESAGGHELDELAAEFNRMASHLESARSDLVRQGEERLALERRLRETEKLAAVGNLAAGLAHEIAAPLHVIRGRAEMLLKRTADPADERKLRIIIEQIGRITVIVRNLLDFARRREPRLDTVDLGAIVGGVLEFLDWEMTRARTRVLWEGPLRVLVRGDGDLLHQVFINLLMNALQAIEPMQRNGRILIRTRVAGPAAAGGDANGPGAHAILEIEDNGPGIADDVLPRIFEPFVTTKPHGTGTGLGLAVARAIIEEHGGRLEAGNITEPGGARIGARFRVSLPLAPIEELVGA